MHWTYSVKDPHGKTTESYSYKMYNCNPYLRPHGFQQQQKLWCSERMDRFKNPLWSWTYMAGFILKFFFASSVRSEGICAFEKEREKRREIPLAGRSLNARIYGCVPLPKTMRWLFLTTTGVFPSLHWCVGCRPVNYWEAALLGLNAAPCGWANTHMWQPRIRKW